jgi:hypothetical protein
VRTRLGARIPLFGGVEAKIDGSPIRCIRALLRARVGATKEQSDIKYQYLRGASNLQAQVPGGDLSGSLDLGTESRGFTGRGAGPGDAGQSAIDVIRRRGVLLVVRRTPKPKKTIYRCRYDSAPRDVSGG